MQPDNLTPADQELARVLAGVQPAASSLDRDALMFRAGRASAERRVRAFEGLSACAVIVLVVSLFTMRPAPPAPTKPPLPMQAAVQPPAPAAPSFETPPAEISVAYLKLRDRVLAHGVDALPSPPAPRPGASVRPLGPRALDSLLTDGEAL